MNISTTKTYTGVSLRDHFAGLAMQGFMLADPESSWSYEECAKYAYKQADAMLEERDDYKEHGIGESE